MYLLAQKLNGDGTITGKEYAYTCDFEANEGQFIVAPFGANEVILAISKVDVPAEELKFDPLLCKMAIRIATAEDMEGNADAGLDIKTITEKPAIITINFEEIEKSLTETLKTYKGMVVIDSTLRMAKSKQKELAGLRNKIETFRKTKKKLLLAPVDAFETQCKSLVALIEQAEAPIKLGIAEFDDAKKEQKRITAAGIIGRIVAEYELQDEYAKKVVIEAKYANLTITDSEVENDVIRQVTILLGEQNKEIEKQEIIRSTVAEESKKLKTPLTVEQFSKIMNYGSTLEVLNEIRGTANRQYGIENPPAPEPVIETKTSLEAFAEVLTPEAELSSAEIDMEITEPIKIRVDTCFANIEIRGTLEELKSVTAFLKEHYIWNKVGLSGKM